MAKIINHSELGNLSLKYLSNSFILMGLVKYLSIPACSAFYLDSISENPVLAIQIPLGSSFSDIILFNSRTVVNPSITGIFKSRK